MKATVSSRQYLSMVHIWSAFDLAHKCDLLEAELLGIEHFTVEHRALVTNSVMSAVSFLEALANEVFQDAADRDAGTHDSPPIRTLTDQIVARLGEFWIAT